MAIIYLVRTNGNSHFGPDAILAVCEDEIVAQSLLKESYAADRIECATAEGDVLGSDIYVFMDNSGGREQFIERILCNKKDADELSSHPHGATSKWAYHQYPVYRK